METKEIRRNNLRELMARYARQGVNQNEFATLVESSAPTLSQIIGEKSSRNLGDNLAGGSRPAEFAQGLVRRIS